MMGGSIDWAALDTISAYIGVDNPMEFVDALLTIKAFRERTR